MISSKAIEPTTNTDMGGQIATDRRLREQKTNGNLLAGCLSAIARKRAGTSYTTRQAGWSDSIRGRREGSSPVRSGPCPEPIVKLLRSRVQKHEIVELREVTETEGVCITSHASQCRTVNQVVVLPDGADAKGWYVSLSRARDSMHVYTRDKAALRQSVMYPGERKSVWELIQAFRRSEPQSRNRMMPDRWVTRQTEIVREIGMER